MGKKITSSSPLDTIAFDAIPNTWQYANVVGKFDVGSGDGTSSGVAPGGYYTSTAGNTDIGGDESQQKACPAGKHMEEGICVKNEKSSRGSRLEKGIAEDEALGKTASAARKRKRLAGWQLSQEKRTKQIEGEYDKKGNLVKKGQTTFGRGIRNIGTAFTKGYDADGDGTISPSEEVKSRQDLKLSRAKDIKTMEDDRAKCIGDPNKKWENKKCVAQPGLNTQKTNFNPVSTSSFIGPSGNVLPGFGKTGIQKQPLKPCPKGQKRVGKFCI